jgi:hypothetical protein
MCTPEWIRTIDLDVRNVTLYPTELRVHATILEYRGDIVSDKKQRSNFIEAAAETWLELFPTGRSWRASLPSGQKAMA